MDCILLPVLEEIATEKNDAPIHQRNFQLFTTIDGYLEGECCTVLASLSVTTRLEVRSMNQCH